MCLDPDKRPHELPDRLVKERAERLMLATAVAEPVVSSEARFSAPHKEARILPPPHSVSSVYFAFHCDFRFLESTKRLNDFKRLENRLAVPSGSRRGCRLKRGGAFYRAVGGSQQPYGKNLQKGDIPALPTTLYAGSDSSSVFLRPVRRAINNPTSNSNHIGTASKLWEIMSGGVSSIPTTKQPTIT